MFKFKETTYLLITCNIFVVLSVTNAQENPVIVNSSHGLIQGEQGGLIGDRPWYRFRGIPYAEPPVGALRFEPPVKKAPWQGILNATVKGSTCVQGSNPVIGNEDCLYIEIYTPQYPNKTSKLPVLVYTYGGAFYVGSLDFEAENPNLILAENVIIASFEYRLGAFGFLATEDNTVPGNAGLKDQLLALQWIKENIENFGGDPEKITFFGQSAGAASIAYFLQAPQAKGLFSGAIMLSGSTLNSWTLTRNPLNFAKSVALSLLIQPFDVPSMVQSLKSVSAQQLQGAVASRYTTALLNNPTAGLPLGPVVEPSNPGAIIRGNSHELLKNGNFNAIPIMIGHTTLEARTSEGVSAAVRLLIALYTAIPSYFVPVGMNINNLLIQLFVGNKIRTQYSVGRSDLESLQWLTDDQFIRAIYEYVRQYSKRAPVYFHSFGHEGSLFGVQNRTFPGVGHTEDLGYVFDFGYNGTSTDYLVRRRFVKLITNFIKYRNPTPQPDSQLQNITWPANTGSSTIRQLSIKANLEVVTNPYSKNMTFWQNLFDEYGRPPFSTY